MSNADTVARFQDRLRQAIKAADMTPIYAKLHVRFILRLEIPKRYGIGVYILSGHR